MAMCRSKLDPALGGVQCGQSVSRQVAYLNTVLTQTRIWGPPLYFAKIDLSCMFASTCYDFLCETSFFFGVPLPWAQVFMRQVKGNALELTTVRREHIRILMYQGLVEGAPTSVIAVALILSRLLTAVRQSQQFSSIAELEADTIQQGIPLPHLGWLDDWIFFPECPMHLDILVRLWASLCEKANWRI